MEDRTQKLLNTIVKEYVKTAQPVGSKLLVDKYKLDISSATVRNEMMALEDEGYIMQPYTSAGRVPTEKGYQFYIDNFLVPKNPNQAQNRVLKEVVRQFRQDHRDLIKNLAKRLAEDSGQMIFVSFGDNDFYYTGISNIFSQPEFVDQEVIYDLSRVIDHFDEVSQQLFDLTDEEVVVIIGSSNPFGNMCSAVLANYSFGGDKGIFGLLGPMRMDYDVNLGLVEYTRNLINNLE